MRIMYLLLLLLLTACSTNAVTGRSQLMIVSDATAITISSEAYSSLISGLSEKGKLSEDEKLVERVKYISNKLITEAVKFRADAESWDWEVNVIDDPNTVNAFCMAGGKMAIYTGIVKQLELTDDEIAQIMGHEIAHAISSHTAEKMSVNVAGRGAVAAIAAASKPKDRRLVNSTLALAAHALITLPNSRQAETEADRIGIELAARAGYDPKADISLWEKMQKLDKGSGRLEFLSTHPSHESRINDLQSLQSSMEVIYKNSNRSAYEKNVMWATSSLNSDKKMNTKKQEDLQVAERLRELKRLQSEGLVSDDEFVQKKTELLKQF